MDGRDGYKEAVEKEKKLINIFLHLERKGKCYIISMESWIIFSMEMNLSTT